MEGNGQVLVSGGRGSGTDGTYTSNTHREQYVEAANSKVVNRAIFYNNSAFDNRDPAPGVADGDAIATDKTPLFPGENATFANFTSYARGINGLIIDLSGPHGAISAADFVFQTSDAPQLGTWLDAPTPLSVTILGGEGVGNSERVEIIWPDGSIRNTWLKVTVLANQATGLAAPDVFLFGNLVGESGAALEQVATVDAIDANLIRRQAATDVGITNRFDFNRDGRVTSTDALITLMNVGNQLPLIFGILADELVASSDLPPGFLATIARHEPSGAGPLTALIPAQDAPAPAPSPSRVLPPLLQAQQTSRPRPAAPEARTAQDAALLDDTWWE
jgi:hypothetical protein